MKNKFLYPLTVKTEHIDALKHVNNEIYIKWLMEAAGAHSSSLGYSIEKYLFDGACFVVRRHEVDYLAPAFLGEELVVETWVENMQKAKSTRVYNIRRLADQKILIHAKTLWVYVDLITGRPTEISTEIINAFSDFIHGDNHDDLKKS